MGQSMESQTRDKWYAQFIDKALVKTDTVTAVPDDDLQPLAFRSISPIIYLLLLQCLKEMCSFALLLPTWCLSFFRYTLQSFGSGGIACFRLIFLPHLRFIPEMCYWYQKVKKLLSQHSCIYMDRQEGYRGLDRAGRGSEIIRSEGCCWCVHNSLTSCFKVLLNSGFNFPKKKRENRQDCVFIRDTS